jgi:c-di-GMP-binding flagellar brake protein YcgR
MKKETVYKGRERRKFVRLNYLTPLAYKVCKKSTISKLVKGYTSNISQSGLLCNIRDKVKKDDIMWISFNRDMLSICTDLETRSLIYQNGIVGKVVRSKHKRNGSYDVGIQFITREEKNLTNIYPKVYFLEKQQQIAK